MVISHHFPAGLLFTTVRPACKASGQDPDVNLYMDAYMNSKLYCVWMFFFSVMLANNAGYLITTWLSPKLPNDEN